MAKRKNADDTMNTPKKSRQATHDQDDVDQNDSSSETSDTERRLMVLLGRWQDFQAYWDFVAKHGIGKNQPHNEELFT